jgi:hypothetical protein
VTILAAGYALYYSRARIEQCQRCFALATCRFPGSNGVIYV